MAKMVTFDYIWENQVPGSATSRGDELSLVRVEVWRYIRCLFLSQFIRFILLSHLFWIWLMSVNFPKFSFLIISRSNFKLSLFHCKSKCHFSSHIFIILFKSITVVACNCICKHRLLGLGISCGVELLLVLYVKILKVRMETFCVEESQRYDLRKRSFVFAEVVVDGVCQKVTGTYGVILSLGVTGIYLPKEISYVCRSYCWCCSAKIWRYFWSRSMSMSRSCTGFDEGFLWFWVSNAWIYLRSCSVTRSDGPISSIRDALCLSKLLLSVCDKGLKILTDLYCAGQSQGYTFLKRWIVFAEVPNIDYACLNISRSKKNSWKSTTISVSRFWRSEGLIFSPRRKTALYARNTNHYKKYIKYKSGLEWDC